MGPLHGGISNNGKVALPQSSRVDVLRCAMRVSVGLDNTSYLGTGVASTTAVATSTSSTSLLESTSVHVEIKII